MAIEQIKSEQLEEALASENTVLLYFTATWCGPCRMLGPVMVSFEEKHGEMVDVLKVDIDEAPDIAEKFGIRGVPTLVAIVDGEVKHQMTGAKPLPGLEKEFAEFLQTSAE
jgi:thioredoxin 1